MKLAPFALVAAVFVAAKTNVEALAKKGAPLTQSTIPVSHENYLQKNNDLQVGDYHGVGIRSGLMTIAPTEDPKAKNEGKKGQYLGAVQASEEVPPVGMIQKVEQPKELQSGTTQHTKKGGNLKPESRLLQKKGAALQAETKPEDADFLMNEEANHGNYLQKNNDLQVGENHGVGIRSGLMTIAPTEDPKAKNEGKKGQYLGGEQATEDTVGQLVKPPQEMNVQEHHGAGAALKGEGTGGRYLSQAVPLQTAAPVKSSGYTSPVQQNENGFYMGQTEQQKQQQQQQVNQNKASYIEHQQNPSNLQPEQQSLQVAGQPVPASGEYVGELQAGENAHASGETIGEMMEASKAAGNGTPLVQNGPTLTMAPKGTTSNGTYLQEDTVSSVLVWWYLFIGVLSGLAIGLAVAMVFVVRERRTKELLASFVQTQREAFKDMELGGVGTMHIPPSSDFPATL